MNEIIKISKKYKIPIIEDAAQSIGSKYYGKLAGSIGDIGCFSTHPLKNLNACGDGGFLTTNNKQYYILKKFTEQWNAEETKLNILDIYQGWMFYKLRF